MLNDQRLAGAIDAVFPLLMALTAPKEQALQPSSVSRRVAMQFLSYVLLCVVALLVFWWLVQLPFYQFYQQHQVILRSEVESGETETVTKLVLKGFRVISKHIKLHKVAVFYVS